jgi:hypothetical protein
MPRRSRIDAPGALHHVIARGIEKRKIFQDDSDRNNFLERLGEILKETRTPGDLGAGQRTEAGERAKPFMLLGGTGSWHKHGRGIEETRSFTVRGKSVGQAG